MTNHSFFINPRLSDKISVFLGWIVGKSKGTNLERVGHMLGKYFDHSELNQWDYITFACKQRSIFSLTSLLLISAAIQWQLMKIWLPTSFPDIIGKCNLAISEKALFFFAMFWLLWVDFKPYHESVSNIKSLQCHLPLYTDFTIDLFMKASTNRLIFWWSLLAKSTLFLSFSYSL